MKIATRILDYDVHVDVPEIYDSNAVTVHCLVLIVIIIINK